MSSRLILFVFIALAACRDKEPAVTVQGTYLYDLSFLQQHDKTAVELHDETGQSRIILSPKYQGRVMTSTSAGDDGLSYGWINYDLISSNTWNNQFNPVGGEERFWLGPEGGQYSLYFAPGDSFKIQKWQVPPLIDTVAYSLIEKTDTSAIFETTGQIQNYSGTTFDLRVDRRIKLLHRRAVEESLGVEFNQALRCVGYRTTNTIIHTGQTAWKKETGLISIWLLGMFTPSAATTVIIPYVNDRQSKITTNYFGEIPANRLDIRDSVVLFKCDGNYRSKIGLPPGMANPWAGSYDAEKKILTLIRFDIDRSGDYVNSKWEIQDQPYKGDVLNSYNDGPLADGAQLGPFYELESSSSARALQPGESQTYSQMTCHLEGDEEALRNVAKKLLGFDIQELTVKE